MTGLSPEQRERLTLAWHDNWCPEGAECRTRVPHAATTWWFVADTLAAVVADMLAQARAEGERRGAVQALRDAADAIQALHPGEVKNSVIFLRDRARRIEGATSHPSLTALRNRETR